MDNGRWIIDAAIDNGATLAGIAGMEALVMSASHTIYRKMGDYSGVGTVKDGDARRNDSMFSGPDAAGSVLVIGLAHPKDEPALDWWDGRGTPGNRVMIDIVQRTGQQIENRLKINTRKLHYYVEKGGVFLKDAAVLAGLGCIGRNNMVVTPSHGPRIRLRALLLDAALRPTGPIVFDPCADCNEPCRRVCPEKAMAGKAPIFRSLEFAERLSARDGFYDRERCNIKMEKDESESMRRGAGERTPVQYCRQCELVCPVGKESRTDASNSGARSAL
jgi:epoxyqueuosine reductase